jgi:hypothetical protein
LVLPESVTNQGRLKPGTLFIQLIANDSPTDPAYAFLIYKASMSAMPSGTELTDSDATLTHIIGPILTDADWRAFYNSLRSFASTRPGGFYCDGLDGGCAENKVGEILDGEGQRLAWGPITPIPPPPESFGVMQNTQTVTKGTLGTWASLGPEARQRLYASLSSLPRDAPSCREVKPTDAQRKELGEYVYRALATRQASYGPHPYPYPSPK